MKPIQESFYFSSQILLYSCTFLQTLILNCCRFYDVFVSGANHTIYAQFMSQASLLIKGQENILQHGFMP